MNNNNLDPIMKFLREKPVLARDEAHNATTPPSIDVDARVIRQ